MGKGTVVRGRTGQLATLLQAWEAARSGRGRTVVVEGKAGAGKTCLLWELERRVRASAPDSHVLYGGYTPHSPMDEGSARVLALGNLRAFFEEQAGSDVEAERLARNCLSSGRRSGSGGPVVTVQAAVVLARLLVRQGRGGEALALLDDTEPALLAAPAPNYRLLADVLRARTGGDTVLRARQCLHEQEARLDHGTRMEAHHGLWLVTADEAHLAQAGRLLASLVRHAPVEDRSLMLDGMRRHREIVEALSGHGWSLSRFTGRVTHSH